MSSTVISVENISKCYRLGLIGGGTLRDDLERWWARVWRKPDPLQKIGAADHGNIDGQILWALRDVSFTVQQGEVLGIIGRNGAGKSTLLKIISQITSPTSGQIKVKGRVASLLEVGTGFHPELTGRENIYLNGAILGMTKSEVARKMDEIIAFSEIKQFIDTPVKRYSSGMYVRLAFAVAAHLDPEILIVDEVLAVGDIAFQKKCLGKMGDVASYGRTVLFVSHNMGAVRALCHRVILIDQGEINTEGSTEKVLQRYYEHLREIEVTAETSVADEKKRRGSGAVRFDRIIISNTDNEPQHSFIAGETVRFTLHYQVFLKVEELLGSVAINSNVSSGFIASTGKFIISQEPLNSEEEGTVYIDIPNINLNPGDYPLYFWMGNSAGQPYDVVDDLTVPLSINYRHDEINDSSIPEARSGFFSLNYTVIFLPEIGNVLPNRQNEKEALI